ncbi:MAG: anti-sigma factor [Alphaproteobacteria bacterium]
MSEPRTPVSEEDLHAAADGNLQPDRRATIDAHLARDPEAAAEVDAWRRQNEALHALFDRVAAEPVPTQLRPANLRAPRLRPATIALRAAAAVALLLAGGLAGWLGHERYGDGTAPQLAILAREAVMAHRVYSVEVRHPVEVRAEEAHLVNWLSRRLEHRVNAPDLGAAGWKLVGGRLLPAQTGPAAQFMYESPDGERLTLYIRTNRTSDTTQFRVVEDNGFTAFYWLDGPLGYALIGKASREKMIGVANAVYERLTP